MPNKAMSEVLSINNIDTKQSKLPPVICLMGPTASGKTALAMALHDALPCDIISVDSALVYRDMDIGTAKPTIEELAKYPHRLINLIDPSESYSAADFCRDALIEIEKSRSNNRIPLLVGGTMMYFKSLIDGISPLPIADVKIRQEIEAEAKEKSEAEAKIKEAKPEETPAKAETSEAEVSELVENAVDNADIEKTSVTNSIDATEDTVYNKYRKAFGIDQFDILT